jgi:hypothetical protein
MLLMLATFFIMITTFMTWPGNNDHRGPFES